MKELEEFYRTHRTRLVVSICRKVGGNYDVAEDVVQEAFMRAISFYPSFDPERGKLSSWFNKIMYNAMRDVQNRGVEDLSTMSEDCSADDVMGGETRLDSRARTILAEDIRKVKNKLHRRVLYLFYVLGYSSKEISMIEVGVSQSNVTTIAMRFKKQVN